MKFQEIDLTIDSIFGKIPIEIEVIFKYSFQEGKLDNRFIKITKSNYFVFALSLDYWNFIEEWKKGLVYGENGKPIKDITPYLEAYSKGFLDGYFEFENEVKDINQIFNQNSFPIDAIFKEARTEEMAFSSRGYFYKNDDSNEKPIPIIKKDLLYSGGIKVGRNYKAWFYIVKNPKPFIQLFREFYSSSFELYENEFRKWNSHHEGYISPLQIVIDEIRAKKPNEPKQENKSSQIENKFNQMPMNEVRSHFLPLIEKENPSGQIWMKKEDFEIFLRRSFGGETNLHKPKINIGNRGKYAVVKLFFLFYQKCINENLQENRKKDPFIKLLQNSFNGTIFDDLTSHNFKVDKSSYEWK